MDRRDVKVFLTNFNNLETGFRAMVDWFLEREMKITVLDNTSTYPPLLKYYTQMSDKIEVIHVGYNANTWAFWQAGYNTEENTRLPYITSDADCPPDPDCPLDLVEKMLAVLDAVPAAVKVCPGLRIDNLPDWYDRKKQAIECQTSVAQSPDWGITQSDSIEVAGVKIHRAITDTTLTMWRGGVRSEGRLSTNDWQAEQYRMEYPYVLKHTPWYSDSSKPSVEALFYRAQPNRSTDPVFGL